MSFLNERFCDGTGGMCCKCNRVFGCQYGLDVHQGYCSDLLIWKKVAQETGAYEEPNENETWFDGLTIEYSAWYFAHSCMEYLNQQSHRQYKLVKPGNYQVVIISGGPIIHLNFKAKPLFGPVVTFFAQLRKPSTCLGGQDSVDCVIPLGPGEPLPHWGSAFVGDCRYCRFPVHHPSPGMEGCENLIVGDPIYDEIDKYNPGPYFDMERFKKFNEDELSKLKQTSASSKYCTPMF